MNPNKQSTNNTCTNKSQPLHTDSFYPSSQHSPAFIYSVQHRIWDGVVEAYSSENNQKIPFDYDRYQMQQHTYHSNMKNCSQQLPTQLVSTDLGWHHISGKHDTEFLRRKFEQSWQHTLQEGAKFLLFSSDAEWDDCITASTSIPLTGIRRLPFYYPQTATQICIPILPSGYHLQKINAAVIQKSTTYDETYIKTYWGSIENYLQNGFGYAIMYEEQPICTCISIIANPVCAEIDIETHTDHRGKGLAQIVAHAFIQECSRRGIDPRWDCIADNEASRQLALKLGFTEGKLYHIWTKA